jgi:hypothetical protein
VAHAAQRLEGSRRCAAGIESHQPIDRQLAASTARQAANARFGSGHVGNIREAFGRGARRDRIYRLGVAKGETEETIGHLATNFHIGRLTPRQYWPLHNLLVVIVKMLNGLIYD